MDTQVLSVNNPEVKIEKTETSPGKSSLQNKLTGLKNLANIIEEGFQYQFVDLEEYLTRLLEEQNYGYSPGLPDEEKISMAKAKAKEYFKNYANEVFRSLKETVESEKLHHILPQSYINDVVLNLKEKIENNLQILGEEIIEGILKSETSSIQDGSRKISKIKKGKTKIPKRALTILKNWLTDHFQDPYPTHAEKLALAKEAGIDFKQVQNWFTNARGRVWKKSYNPEKFSSLIQDKLVEEVVKPPVKQIQPVKDFRATFNNNYLPYMNYQMPKQMMQPTYVLAPQYR